MVDVPKLKMNKIEHPAAFYAMASCDGGLERQIGAFAYGFQRARDDGWRQTLLKMLFDGEADALVGGGCSSVL